MTIRLLVTGSRDWDDPYSVHAALDQATDGHDHVTVVHGACETGADQHAAQWARATGATIEPHPADWKRHGTAAGPIRNAAMVDLGADLCLAFIGPCTSRRCRLTEPHDSHGAATTAKLARRAGIPVRIHTIEGATA